MTHDSKKPATEIAEQDLDDVQGGININNDHRVTGGQQMTPLDKTGLASGAGVSPFRTAGLRLEAEVEEPTARVGANPTPHP